MCVYIYISTYTWTYRLFAAARPQSESCSNVVCRLPVFVGERVALRQFLLQMHYRSMMMPVPSQFFRGSNQLSFSLEISNLRKTRGIARATADCCLNVETKRRRSKQTSK